MFRIKNIRSSTVAKQSQVSLLPIRSKTITSHPPQSKIDPKKKETRAQNHLGNPQQARAPSRPEAKIRTPKLDHKLKLASKAHVEQIGSGKIGKLSFQLKHPSISRNENPKLQVYSQVVSKTQKLEQKQHPEKEMENQSPQLEETEKIQFPVIQESKQEPLEEPHISLVHQQQLQKIAQQEEELRSKAKKADSYSLQQKQIERVKEEEAKMKQQKELVIQKQRQQEAQRERQLKEMMEKVEKRRRAREQQKEQRRNAEEARAQLLREQESQRQIAGIVALSDPLAHIEMSEALMDRQVQMLLSMKFAGYPNQEAIQHQIQELDRINRSYLLVREDPCNPLLSGLANFRIELFNRVGELVMEGQKQMGPSASGLRVIQADPQGSSAIKEVKITRGLEGHVQRLLKNRTLDQRDECPICLHRMPEGEQVYQVNCGHHFHKNCLEQWLGNTANCPVCRYNIKFDHP